VTNFFIPFRGQGPYSGQNSGGGILLRKNENWYDLLHIGGSNGGRGAAAPINWMHLKTSENFARKCIIFAHDCQNFSGEENSTPTLPPPIPHFWIRHCCCIMHFGLISISSPTCNLYFSVDKLSARLLHDVTLV